MTPLTITLNLELDPWRDLFAGVGVSQGTVERVGLLPNGTTQGRACVEILVRLPDGTVVIAETTLALFTLAAVAARGVTHRTDGGHVTSDYQRRSFGHLITGGDNVDVLRGVGPDKPAPGPPPPPVTQRPTGLDWDAISPPRRPGAPSPWPVTAQKVPTRFGMTAPPQTRRAPLPAGEPAMTDALPHGDPDWLELYDEARQSSRASYVRAATRMFDAATALKSLINTDAQNEAARARVAALEAELAEARAAAGMTPSKRTAAAVPAYDPTAVRAWAKTQPEFAHRHMPGRYVAADIVAAYNLAHHGTEA